MKRALLLSLTGLLLFAHNASTQGGASHDIQAKLQKLKLEPTVRDVQEAALRYFRVNQDQIDSMRSRARAKALAPVLEVSGGYTESTLDDVSTNSYLNFQTFDNPGTAARPALAGTSEVRPPSTSRGSSSTPRSSTWRPSRAS